MNTLPKTEKIVAVNFNQEKIKNGAVDEKENLFQN